MSNCEPWSECSDWSRGKFQAKAPGRRRVHLWVDKLTLFREKKKFYGEAGSGRAGEACPILAKGA